MRVPTAAEMIRALELKPHPEGGHYRETFRDSRDVNGRPASTAILFLLAQGERSHWHRIDAVEIWHYYAGAALKLSLVDGSTEEIFRLGADIAAGEVPQVTVPARAWQAAESLGQWTLTAVRSRRGFPLKASSSRPKTGRRTRERGKTKITDNPIATCGHSAACTPDRPQVRGSCEP
jgi:uncharacterized protein